MSARDLLSYAGIIPLLPLIGAVIAHAARLDRTTWGSCLRVEVDDDRLATEVRELHRPTVLVGQLEVGGRLSLLDHARILAVSPERSRASYKARCKRSASSSEVISRSDSRPSCSPMRSASSERTCSA